MKSLNHTCRLKVFIHSIFQHVFISCFAAGSWQNEGDTQINNYDLYFQEQIIYCL